MIDTDGSCHVAPSESLAKSLLAKQYEANNLFGMGSTGVGEGNGMTSLY